MQLRVIAVSVAVLSVLTLACNRTIQTDSSISEERSSSAETGPVTVTAMVRMNDGAPLPNATFHLVTISRDGKGDLNQVEQLLTITGVTDGNGTLKFQVPRERVTGGKELSLGFSSSNPYGPSPVIRRKDAKNILSFKADEKTKSVDVGEVVIPLR